MSKETEDYARGRNLPEPVVLAVNRLEYSTNTRTLIDDLGGLPPGIQRSGSTLRYVQEVVADGRVSDAELSKIDIALKVTKSGISRDAQDTAVECVLFNTSPDLAKSYEYLQAVSDKAAKRMAALGMDDNVTDYITLISSLADKEFAKYALENALCMEDHQLVELERNFLQEPDRYLNEVYAYEMSQVNAVDPELAVKLAQLPCMKEKPNIKTVEALDDILGLAADPVSRPKLETLYGKGIRSKMQRVALERLFYHDRNDSYDMNEALEGTEWYVNSKLAEFQEKYNSEMDQDGVPGPKPAIRGMGLLHEPLSYLVKNANDSALDYAIMRWVLRCNAVRLYCDNGNDENYAFFHVKAAQAEGLDVWLHFFPLFQNANISEEEFKEKLKKISVKSQELKIAGLMVSSEVDI